MESKIVKRPRKESESIPSLKKIITDINAQISKAKNKILEQATTILTLKNQKAKCEYRFTIL